MAKANNGRPPIPRPVQTHLWLRAGGRCEFRGCNKILFEDNVTQDPINGSHIAHIISWTESGPRGDKELSSKLATDISNLMLTCPEHNHLIDTGENVEKYTVSVLREMKREHESAIRQLTEIRNQLPKRVIELSGIPEHKRILEVLNDCWLANEDALEVAVTIVAKQKNGSTLCNETIHWVNTENE